MNNNFVTNFIELIFSLLLFINAFLFIPQAIKLYKEKSTNGTSLLTFGGFLLIQFFVVLHGIIQKDKVLALGYSLSMLTCGSVIFLILLYRKNPSNVNMHELTIEEFINQMPEHVYWKDREHKFVDCNKNNWVDFGLKSIEDYRGKTDYDIFPETEAKTVWDVDEKVIQTGSAIIVEEKFKKANGDYALYLSHKIALRNKNNAIIGLFGISVDITHAKQEIDDKLNMLENIIAMMPGHVYWIDREGSILGCNDQQARSAGLKSRKDAIGKYNRDLPWNINKDALVKELDSTNQNLMLNKTTYTAEEPATLSDGTQATFLSHKTPLYNSRGEVTGMVGISIDITDRKEKKRLEVEAIRDKAIIEEQAKFNKVIRQIAHDMASPTSSVESYVRRFSSTIPENERVTLRNATERISGILQLILSKFEDKSSTENKDMLVSLAVIQIMNEKREEHRESGVKFEVSIHNTADFTFIHINPGLFKRMISNLVNNAVQALQGRPDAKVSLQVVSNAGTVTITVKDNGPGMPKHIQEKMAAGIEITEGKENGHGIGLTQVKDTISAANGKYIINASAKRGTQIYLCFPEIATPHWLEKSIKLTKDDTIVILDDDQSIHGTWNSNFEDTLKKNPSIQIKHFTQGTEAVTYINSLTIEQKRDIFLLTDYELLEQGINGLEVVTQTGILRSLLVTSYATQTDIQKSVTEAGIKLLPKELASSATIIVDKKIPKWSSKVDMVWVEDQQWYVDNEIKKHYSHLLVDTYYDPISFMEDIQQYPLDTRIILDTYYSSPDNIPYLIDGFQLAKQLHAMGYTKLILYAGEEAGAKAPEYLRVILKNDPRYETQLDKI